MEFEILQSYDSTKQWLDEVSKASDSHRNELGFFPRSVFEEFARRNKILVLIDIGNYPQRYAGHLLFDLNFPRASVRQIVTLPQYRHRRGATIMLERLKRILYEHHYASIYARVAEDMADANAFWQRNGFYVQRTDPGGTSRNRTILVRVLQLASPQLFPTNSYDETNPLGLKFGTENLPMFLLDMNVLFDLNPRRPRREDAVKLIQAERMNLCRLAISDEIRNELQRTTLASRNTDPMAALVDTFPCVPIDARTDQQIVDDLARIVFPDAGKLSSNQKSDLRHICATVQNDLAGLITNDNAILEAASAIEAKYKIQVVSSVSFFPAQIEQINSSYEAQELETLRLAPVSSSTELVVRTMLSQAAELSGSEIATNWLSIDNQNRITHRYAVWAGERCIGYLTWPSWQYSGSLVARAAVDESHTEAIAASRILLRHFLECAGSNCKKVIVELPPKQTHLREIGVALGFSGASQSGQLVKSTLNRVVTLSGWTSARDALKLAGGPVLPDQPPPYRYVDQQVQISTPEGSRAFIALDRLESLLSPVLLCLPGRPAVITPIRREYAEPLLGHSKQRSLLPQGITSLFHDRLYVSDPKTMRHFRRGTLILFYESGKSAGRSEIVAIARVREAYLRPWDSLVLSERQRTVLTEQRAHRIGASKMKTITLFDNIFILERPVGLATLRVLGCGDPSRLITTQPITDYQLQSILFEAVP